MLNIKSHHIDNKTIKLMKRYLNEYEKIVKVMQQTILQKRKQIVYDVKAIVKYIVFNFKNAVNNDYKNRTTFISSKLKDVKLK